MESPSRTSRGSTKSEASGFCGSLFSSFQTMLSSSYPLSTRNRIGRYRPIVGPSSPCLTVLHAEAGTGGIVDDLFPDGNDGVRDLRALALGLLENDALQDFLAGLSDAITKPEIPTEIEDVRIMSLHKSKGLFAPVTVIAGCIEGLLPKQPRDGLSPAETLADIEEQRRLFYVGISRVKSSPAAGKPGTLILTNSP